MIDEIDRLTQSHRETTGRETTGIEDALGDAFLDEDDLTRCQATFNELILEAAVARGSEEGLRIAATVLALYHQGVRDQGRRRQLVEQARGSVVRPMPRFATGAGPSIN